MLLGLCLTGGAEAQARVWLDGETILSVARSCLLESGLPEDLDVAVRPGGTYVAEAGVRWEAKLLPSQDRNQRVRVQALAKDRSVGSWTVVFREPSARLCVYAARALPAGTLLTKSDLVMRPEPSDYRPVVCRSMEDVLGRTLVRGMEPGEVLPQKALVMRPIYRRGDQVSVSLKDDGMSLELTGTALGSGYPGREFRMKAASGKVMTVYLDMEGNPFLPQGRSL